MSLFLTAPGPAEEPEESPGTRAPGRRLVVAFTYPGITVHPDGRISLDLLVNNRGDTDETVLLEVAEKPPGWKTTIKTYSEVVSGAFVAAGKERTLTFSAEPETEDGKRLPPGEFRFQVLARTPDGSWNGGTDLQVTVLEKEKSEAELTVETSYPVLRGASDEEFEFTLDVRNESDEETVVSFKAEGPPGWTISFKPAYEEKQISSLQLSADQSKSVEVEVKPPYNATVGEFPIAVEAGSPKAQAAVELKVILTGTYKLEVGTPRGLLSLTTEAGRNAKLSIFARNLGSAPQGEITFQSFKPENWEVKFEPEKLEGLEAGQLEQVEVTITPPREALVGDYSVAIQAQGDRASDDLELRVTVKASTVWGWIGVGIIVLVIAGLAVTFRLLGRR